MTGRRRQPRRPRVEILALEVHRAESWAYLVATRDDLRRAWDELRHCDDEYVERKRAAVDEALRIRFAERPDVDPGVVE